MATIALSLGGGDVYGKWLDCHSCGTDNSCSGSGGSGECAFTAGESAQSNATNSMCIGYKSATSAGSSLSFGNLLITDTNENDNMVIGFGNSPANPLTNDISNSIMIGVNSTIPTMYIEDAGGSGNRGRVGIGTTDPDGMLHLLEDDSTNTVLVIEAPTDQNFTITEPSSIINLIDKGPIWIVPNPSNSLTTISLPTTQPYTLQLIDATGRLVQQLRQQSTSTTLNVAEFAPGLYSIVASTEKGARYTGRLVVEH